MNLVKHDLKDNTCLRILGRTNVHRDRIPLLWTGSGIEGSIKASELWFTIDADWETYEPWISIVINGAYVSRIMLNKGLNEICLFRSRNAEEITNFKLIREVQCMPEDALCRVEVVEYKTDGTLLPPPKHKYKFEFIGDSITSGEGTIGARKENDWLSMWFSTENNYIRFVTDAMDAEYRVMSQSGWGVYCAWDNDITRIIPPHYENICSTIPATLQKALGVEGPYDFSSWTPDVIFVNLGTNDQGAHNNPVWTSPDGKTYKVDIDPVDGTTNVGPRNVQKAIVAFLTKIRKNNPTSKIVWLYGMLGQDLAAPIEDAVMQYKSDAKDDNVYFILLPETTEETVGSRYHSGLKAHMLAAEKIVELLSKEIL